MSKSHVGMGFQVCPICGEKHSEVVLLDKRLRDSLERDNFMGWDLCPEHRKMRDDGFIALVEVSARPTGTHHEQLRNAERTGQLAHIKRESWEQVFNVPCPDVPMVWVEAGTIAAIRAKVGG